MPAKEQIIHVDRARLSAAWTSWWAMFCVVCMGVWYIRGAKDIGEQVVVEVKQLRAEMKQARESLHNHEVRLSTLEEWKRTKTSSAKEW